MKKHAAPKVSIENVGPPRSGLTLLPEPEVKVELLVRQNFEGLCLLQEMMAVGEGKESGSLATGTGLGSDAIVMQWKGRRALVLGRDLFKAWVATWAPEDAARWP